MFVWAFYFVQFIEEIQHVELNFVMRTTRMWFLFVAEKWILIKDHEQNTETLQFFKFFNEELKRFETTIATIWRWLTMNWRVGNFSI